MNIQSLTSRIIAPFLFEQGSVTVLLPGGFKPPHGGHLYIANKYAQDPEVSQVIVLVGPTKRNGLGQEQSMHIWNLLPKNPKIKIVKSSYPSPILSAYEYVLSLPSDSQGVYALGSSGKDEDQQRSVEFAKNINGRYKTDGTKDKKRVPSQVSARVLTSPPPIVYGKRSSKSGAPISATILRQDLQNKNYQDFASNYPNVEPSIVKKIYELLSSQLTEMFHLPVKNIKTAKGKNPIIDLALEYNPQAARYFKTTPDAEILLIFPNERNAIKIKKVGDAISGRVILDIVNSDTTLSMNPVQVIDASDKNYKEWLNKFYTQNNWVKRVVHKRKQPSLTEGGNIFQGTSSIPKQYVRTTLKKFTSDLSKIYPNLLKELNVLGSVGKKDMSGDIDIAISSKLFFDKNGEPKYDEWRINKNSYETLLQLYSKRAKTASSAQLKIRTILKLVADTIEKKLKNVEVDSTGVTNGMLSFKVQQYTEHNQPTNEYVQVDLMVGDVDWLKFSYYSDVYDKNVKGLHRTQFIVALFANKGYTFSHNYGVKNKETQEVEATTPQQAIDLLNRLYNVQLDETILKNYFELQKYLKSKVSLKDYNGVIDIYLKILDSTRTDIPIDLQDYWIKNQDRLQLKGKFLPDDSKLKQYLSESGVAGGDRIPHEQVSSIVDAYEQMVLKKYDKYISSKETGGSKQIKKDHGDLDLIVVVKGTDKVQSKKDFARYINSLPDSIILPFKSQKYAGRKFYISGELVSVLFNFNNLAVQIDNNISFSESETEFKAGFLDLPAEKQGLISGLVKVATEQEPYQQIFSRLGIKITEPPKKNERYEFTVSGQKLSLRLVQLDDNSRELSRQEIWNTTNWNSIQQLLHKYDLSLPFEQLVAQAKTILTDRSKMRVKGLFKSLVSVKGGEAGTPKGDKKLKAIETINTL